MPNSDKYAPEWPWHCQAVLHGHQAWTRAVFQTKGACPWGRRPECQSSPYTFWMGGTGKASNSLAHICIISKSGGSFPWPPGIKSTFPWCGNWIRQPVTQSQVWIPPSLIFSCVTWISDLMRFEFSFLICKIGLIIVFMDGIRWCMQRTLLQMSTASSLLMVEGYNGKTIGLDWEDLLWLVE